MKSWHSCLLALCILLMAGCTYITPFEDMLAPPKLSDEQAKINQALVSSKGQGITLKYPRSGDYLSAFVIHNLDEEPGDEAIVFYEMAGMSSERTMWINFMDKGDDGQWQSMYEMSLKGTSIESIQFVQLGDDDALNIIICYSINQSEKAFKIIRYINKTPVLQYEDAYTYLETGDFFNEGMEHMLVIKNDRALEKSTATLYTWQNGKFSYFGNVELDPTAGEYLYTISGKVNETTQAIIIEHRKSQDQDFYGTDLLYWNGNKLTNGVYDDTASLNVERTGRKVNAYTEYVYPMDINGDGYVELCGTTDFVGYENSPNNERVRMATWNVFNFGVLTESYSTYFSETNGYVFTIPNRWKTSVTAIVSNDGRTVEFYPSGESAGSAKLLLAIRSAHNGEQAPPSDWTELKYNTKLGITYYIKKGSAIQSLRLTEDELNDNFEMLPLG